MIVMRTGIGDVTFTMSDDGWVKLMSGQLTPQQASAGLFVRVVVMVLEG